MASTFTTNKHIEKPASGDYNNAWAAPVNMDWDGLDNAVGGNSAINVTGVGGPTIALVLAQYQPPNINFIGALSADLTYQIPSGVGGVWTIQNATSGSGHVLTISSGGGGGSLALPAGYRTLVVCDGVNVELADTSTAQAALTAAETFATNAANSAESSAVAASEAYTDAKVAAERTAAANASNLASGTVSNAVLPNVLSMPGVTIAADPGTVPTGGAAGDIWLYY